MNIENYRKGSVALVVTIIVVAVVAAGAGVATAYFVVKGKQKKAESEKAPVATPKTEETIKEKTATDQTTQTGLNKYVDTKRGISFSYPISGTNDFNWTVENTSDSDEEGLRIVGARSGPGRGLATDEVKITIQQVEVKDPKQLRDDLVKELEGQDQMGIETDISGVTETKIGGKTAYAVTLNAEGILSTYYFVQADPAQPALKIAVYNPDNQQAKAIVDSIKFGSN